MAKVLIVDDSALGRKLLKKILLNTEHEIVAEAENGEEGILAYERVRPDIVAMDVDMPGINGFETSRRILNDHPEARIIIISAHEINDLKIELVKYGLKHFIIKPVNEENVRTEFKKALEDHYANNSENQISDKTDKAPTVIVSEVKAPGMKVVVSHHSVLNPFVAVKTGEDGNTMTLEMMKDSSFNFNLEDPIVIIHESNGATILSQCDITNADPVNRSLLTEINNNYPLDSEILFQNFPASVYVDFRLVGTRKRYTAVIKTFLLNEIVFKTTVDIEDKEKVSFDIFHKNKVLSIDGSIISRDKGGKMIEYVMKLDFVDYNIKKSYMVYLKELAGSLSSWKSLL